ncbi:MAG: hypothetical protein HXS41_03025 [Theionarchaea archaeon]|nr:hypothetical protein [Theionarchaea archaeon]MBU7000465.1 hypothetical protein [Theionarchaea archaeon]MBU7020008.1 hypothetical protein [Theionarchaea archaeon]MBU7035457.1 hypothetical protein [Theionarchaea archaeon]MBU7041620.1 hypothetical protein [Theionarchaea archaeon]
MKKYVVLALLLLVFSSNTVVSQPFTATVTLFPGCGLQYWYGQEVCGEIVVSDDAWVTRWVEDQNGNIWYHWGTRYYTAGIHHFCGYMGLPIGVHIMNIQAQRISDGAIATDQCQYTVCCASSIWIPGRPSCNCEDVTFSVDIDKTQVSPGDYITMMVTATNNMEADCNKKFDAGHLEIDWGILGGNTSPLEKDVLVKPGETKTILEETHLMPSIPEGDYSVVVYYSDSECTFIDYATISVVLTAEGTLEILSHPDMMNVDEKGRIRVLVRNKSQKEADFVLVATAPSEIYMPQTMYIVTIPRAGYIQIDVEFQPEEKGLYSIELELSSEGQSLGVTAVNIRVEKPVSGQLEILYPPENITTDQNTFAILLITNTGQYDTVYQLTASAANVEVDPVSDLLVPGNQSREVHINMTPLTEGVHQVAFQLLIDNRLMDSASVSFEATQSLPLLLIGGIAVVAVIILGAVLLFYALRR